jgi:bifunctional DNA-binding transcriptional regulator/antitoxin component of YhaV-PrlF toxin-antitoxin module
MKSKNPEIKTRCVITAPLGAKAQITLPKAVREALHVRAPHDLVGFVIQGDRVAITRIEPVPSRDPFTEAEWRAIDKLAAQPPTATHPDSKHSLDYLKRHLHTNG